VTISSEFGEMSPQLVSFQLFPAPQRRISRMAKSITGGCFCGAVRFQCNQPPITTRACWCRDCQYLSSGNASISAIFRTESVKTTGGVNEYVSTADSGNVMRRSFCPKCGTPLFSAASSQPDLMVVRAGALDDPEIVRPASFIWTASAPGWGLIDPDLPNCEGQPTALTGK